ncbi:hypothetical protein [Helicobacter sp. T3_23-1059]
MAIQNHAVIVARILFLSLRESKFCQKARVVAIYRYKMPKTRFFTKTNKWIATRVFDKSARNDEILRLLTKPKPDKIPTP